MATSAYRDWLNAGRPFSVARPISDLVRILRGYGYVVYTVGNDAHLTANPPEDHTPFSATGWPVASPRWWITACDIMPPPDGSGLPTLAHLGSQIALDRNTGVPAIAWLKYMNWQPAGGGIRHEAWDPGHRVVSSSDAGHIHISGRSDCIYNTSDYDPVARLRGGQGGGGGAPSPVVSSPPWPGRYLRLTRPMTHGEDVRTWQAQMRRRGWTIAVDGWFGDETNRVVGQFQAEKGLDRDLVIGPRTWSAAWTAPIT